MICESFLLEIVSEQIAFSSLFSPQEFVLVFGGFYCAEKTGKTISPSCCDGSLLTTHTVPCGCRERERELFEEEMMMMMMRRKRNPFRELSGTFLQRNNCSIPVLMSSRLSLHLLP